MAQSRTDRVQITYILEFQTPFHCGTGMCVGLIDRSVVRDHGEYLYIPGSTLKGVVREKCEQLAYLFEEMDEETRKTLIAPHDLARALENLAPRPRPTMVTRIFGSAIRPGRLSFDDARLTVDDKKQYQSPGDDEKEQRAYRQFQVDIATQVRLDRPTRTAVPGALYTSEFGARGMSFAGRIVGSLECWPVSVDLADSPTPEAATPTYSLLLLLAGLRLLERLGGNKSVGKGECSCTIARVELNRQEVAQARWQGWLEHLDELAFYTMVQEEEV